jgi:hypothetical protein
LILQGNSGNVGIGTTTPGEKFTVQTAVNNWTGNFIGNTTSGQSLGLLITAGTTSAITFRVRGGGSNAGTCYFNGGSAVQYLGGVFNSRITIKEYLP